MHDSTARRLAGSSGATMATHAALLAYSMLAPGAAAAAQADADGASPWFWIFITVSFVGAVGMSFLAGHWRALARLPDGRSPSPARAGAPATAPPSDAMPVLRRLAGALGADPRPLYLLEVDPVSGERLLAVANASGLRQLGTTVDALGRPWAALEGAAPDGLRAALHEPAAARGWWLLRDEGNQRCLILGPDDDGADAETASLVYTVSHDLRAPIRVVEGFTRIVKEDYGRQLDRVGNDHLDRVLAAGARMNQMIDAVLTMARLASQPLTRQPVDLSQLATFIVDDLRRASPDQRIEVQIEPDLRTRGDPTLLRLVLENLLSNAWKYSARNPQACIEFGASTEPGATPDSPGRRVFAVRDNGAGFDMRMADRLFGLFQRLHSAKDFPGTGVGLASVRRIVQRHGGEVWAESEPGRGAAFFFTLAE
jgi:signal transduction histidine kinase